MGIRSGFTLIELSIVLVIIGLLAGGILVGRDLMTAAQVRQQVHQIEQYNTAINTFRLKYNALPGDLKSVDAASLGFKPRSGAAGHGDGNGVLEHCIPGFDPGGMPVGCEIILFWADLSSAGMIDKSFTAATDTEVAFTNFEQTLAYFPATKIDDIVTLIPATNYSTYKLWFATITLQDHVIGGGSHYTWQALYPDISYAIDSKMDDGKPLSGSVRAHETAGGAPLAGFFFGTPIVGPTRCVNPSNEYNVQFHDFKRCQINFLTSF